MYQITYQKRNGEVFNRIRNTMPNKIIGEETSMGWIVVDIKYNFKNGYYSLREYQLLLLKQHRINRLNRTITKFLKRYSTTIALVVLLPLYLFK